MTEKDNIKKQKRKMGCGGIYPIFPKYKVEAVIKPKGRPKKDENKNK